MNLGIVDYIYSWWSPTEIKTTIKEDHQDGHQDEKVEMKEPSIAVVVSPKNLTETKEKLKAVLINNSKRGCQKWKPISTGRVIHVDKPRPIVHHKKSFPKFH